MKRCLFAAGVVVFGLVLMLDNNIQGGDKEKITIKMVMKKAHAGKGVLLPKVLKGTATSEERKELVKLYEALAKNEPPKGDADSWKEKTKALIKAAKANDVDALKKASDCKACHSVHKG